jgi:hypothetical protein
VPTKPAPGNTARELLDGILRFLRNPTRTSPPRRGGCSSNPIRAREQRDLGCRHAQPRQIVETGGSEQLAHQTKHSIGSVVHPAHDLAEDPAEAQRLVGEGATRKRRPGGSDARHHAVPIAIVAVVALELAQPESRAVQEHGRGQ